MGLEVSIITASLNHGAYIETCIQSVQSQKQWHDAKINHVIVDGGSTDNTLALLLKHKDDINHVVNKGEGQTAALNCAMRIVEERFPDTTHIGWISADDFYQGFWLDEMYGQLRKEPENVALICSDIVIYGDSMSRTQWGVQRYFDKAFFGRAGNTVSAPSVLIRFPAFKSLKKKYGFYFNSAFDLCQDFELWYRFLDNNYRIRHIPKLTAYLRLHSQQLSQTKYIAQGVERDIIVEWCCNETGTPLPSWWGKR